MPSLQRNSINGWAGGRGAAAARPCSISLAPSSTRPRTPPPLAATALAPGVRGTH